jgi:hypothetical protein
MLDLEDVEHSSVRLYSEHLVYAKRNLVSIQPGNRGGGNFTGAKIFWILQEKLQQYLAILRKSPGKRTNSHKLLQQ